MIQEIIQGVLYRVKSFKGTREVELFFTHRDSNKQPIDGLTNEALINVVLMRQKYQQKKNPCGENVIQIRHLELWLESSKQRLINKKIKTGHVKFE